MLKLFKRKPKEKPLPQLLDLEGNPIAEGDLVNALRYDLGRCKVLLEGRQYFYESELSGEKVSYVRMIDASTENQKVKKIEEQ